ncbi:MAG: adenosine deaminase [Pseudohongiellaceae bacterium]|jgi:adenosine deaminase
MHSFIHGIPKAELHVHIEGTLEPELMMELAQRNGVRLPFDSVEAIRAAYQFSDLQSFLDLYYAGMAVLRTEDDFYLLTRDYLARSHAQGIRHAEIFFDPQAHTERGVPFATVINGIHRALAEALEKHDLSSLLILCFLRHLSEESAHEALEEALPFKDRFVGVGLDSSELGHPPSKFEAVFARAREAGLHTVAHAGEEGPPEYIHQALDLLQVRRIDHGVRCLEDEALVVRLVAEQVPLTVCPMSNVKLRVFDTMGDHTLAELLDRGLCVTVNSDDPAYFGGYAADNLFAAQQALDLSRDHVIQLARNSLQASFLDDARKLLLLAELDAFISRS